MASTSMRKSSFTSRSITSRVFGGNWSPPNSSGNSFARTLCSAVITTPTMHPPGLAQANIRDVSHPRSISQGRAHPPPIDVGTQTSAARQIPSEDPAHQVPVRCEDVPGCNVRPTISESIADVPRTSESSSRGILVVWCRSHVRRSHWPSDSRSVIAVLRHPKLLSNRQAASRRSCPGRGLGTDARLRPR